MKIKKRDGRIVNFEKNKISNAVSMALAEFKKNNSIANKIANLVTEEVSRKFRRLTPTVEDVQDLVERELIKEGLADVAKAYILYREKHKELREAKGIIGVHDELKLGINAIKVLQARYLEKNEKGQIVETPSQLFRRVAKAIAAPDRKYKQDAKHSEEEFYQAMVKQEFMPNSPTLMNAGTKNQMLSACFVLPVEDSLDGIFGTLKDMAKIQQVGGGTGFSFSRLRPKGDIVGSTHGVASGPISFMRVYDMGTEVIKQGSRRRGANMGILNVNHPDIMEFITAKENEGSLRNFNISVAADDKFMKAAIKGKDYWLMNPHSGQKVLKLNAKDIFDMITAMAWRTGDPGMVFIDEINKRQPTPRLGKIESTNPCVPGNCWIMTEKGPLFVNDLIAKKTKLLINGNKFETNGFFKIGIKPVYKIITKEGFEVEATKEHRFLQAENLTRNKIYSKWTEVKLLKKGSKLILNNLKRIKTWNGHSSESEGYLLGLLVGDGFFSGNNAFLCCWIADKGYMGIKSNVEKLILKIPHRSDFLGWRLNKKQGRYSIKSAPLKKLAQSVGLDWEKKISPLIETASYSFYIGFLRGFFDTDGSVQGNQKKGISIRLSQSNLERLKVVQRMLLRLGIFSKLYSFRRDFSRKELPDGRGGKKVYPIKPQHELVIANENLKLFSNRIGFYHTEKRKKLNAIIKKYKRKLNRERFVTRVEEIKYCGKKLVFDATIEKVHSFDANGFIAHNCGEVPLLSYESCNLGSINLDKIVIDGKINWNKLRSLTRIGIRFLDNVIDANQYPVKETEKITRANRKIGLGVMGLAEMFIQLGIKYDSNKALKTAEKVIKFIKKEADNTSKELAKKRGSFPNIKKSIVKKPKRNATVLSIAPTGTISIIAETSSGIEPLFAVTFVREVLEGTQLLEVNPLFEKIAKERGFYSKELMINISKKGSVQGFKEIPKDVRNLFVTALDIDPEWHVRMQAVFQKHVDNAVSKTVNLPHDAGIEDVKKIYLLAYKLKCKGITIYRYGSKKEQVLYIGEVLKGEKPEEEHVKAHSEYSGGCATGECPF